MFSMLAGVVERVFERVWERLEAMRGRGWAGRGFEYEGSKTGNGGV